MSQRLWLVLFLLSGFWLAHPPVSLAQSETPAAGPSFASALQALQTADYQKALDEFLILLQDKPKDPSLLTNGGIAAAQMGQLGLAASLLRDSAELNPDVIQTQQALAFVLDRLPVKEIPHNIESWEVFRTHVLTGIPLAALLLIGAPLILLVGLLFLRWIGDRRKALLHEETLPRLGWVHILAAVLLTFHLALVFAKLVDLGQPRGTILPEKTAARSAADPQAPALFELFAGFEVLVLRESGQGDQAWVQVRYPGGPTGWIEKKAVRVSVVSAVGG